MLIRFVKLTFRQQEVENFKIVFSKAQPLISKFPGCQHVELLNDLNQSNVFFTLSHWESEEHLENYRHSELFKTTWAQTKPLFDDAPEAWSVEKVS